MNNFTVPKGKYYLCDPCYCFGDHDKWGKVLDDSDFFNRPYKEGKLTAIAFGTKYGDGCYEDQFGNAYGVDAGLIGLVPVKMADKEPRDGIIVTFKEPTACFSDDGTLHFGEYTIKTGDDQEDEEYEN